MSPLPDTSVILPLLSKAQGAFLALAIGDALGWPQEMRDRRRVGSSAVSINFKSWIKRRGGHEISIGAGEYSDDTQLALAVARARARGDSWWPWLTKVELPLWTLYERGGGGATKRAAASWLRGIAPWKQADSEAVRAYFDAGGNGVAMRIMAHAVVHAAEDDPRRLIRDVILDGAATHGHPRALVGATVYSLAAWWLLRARQTVGYGEIILMLSQESAIWAAAPSGRNGWADAAARVFGDYSQAWSEVVLEMRELLSLVRSALDKGALSDDAETLAALGAYGTMKGAGTVTVAASLYLAARYAAQPVQGLLKAAFAVGSDTDTLAAMTGGLLGALAGTDWFVQNWAIVQDRDYITGVACELLKPNPGFHENIDLIGKDRVPAVIRAINQGAKGDLDLDGIRQAQLVSESPQEWRFVTSDGQTLFIPKSKARGHRQTDTRREDPLPQQSALFSSVRDEVTRANQVLVGHGRDGAWRALAEFLENRLKLRVKEFDYCNDAVSEFLRMNAALENTRLVFVIIADDDGHNITSDVRQRIAHRIGFLQGRIDFDKVIVLLESDCGAWENIPALAQIHYPKSGIDQIFSKLAELLAEGRITSKAGDDIPCH